jgi:uncharacterized protein YhfF
VDALDGFARSGLRTGNGAISLATEGKRRALAGRLRTRGYDLDLARAEDGYIPIDVADALSTFIINGQREDARFNPLVTDLMMRANGNERRVRAFGEMVALLWSQGNSRATVALYELWNKRFEEGAFRLFCAYPHGDFSLDAVASIAKNLLSTFKSHPQIAIQPSQAYHSST